MQPIHVVHDLAHLVIESLSGIADGLWGELAAGSHAASRAATARDPRWHKQRRIVSGPSRDVAYPRARPGEGDRYCVANRCDDVPGTPSRGP